jgi:hypothetical protein
MEWQAAAVQDLDHVELGVTQGRPELASRPRAKTGRDRISGSKRGDP